MVLVKNDCLTNLNVGNMALCSTTLFMNEKRIEVEVGFFKLILTILSAISVTLTGFLGGNFFALHLSILISAITINFILIFSIVATSIKIMKLIRML